VQEKPAVGSAFFGALHSDCIAKPTKDANVHFFTNISYSATFYKIFSVNFTSEFRELPEDPTCVCVCLYVCMCIYMYMYIYIVLND